MQYIITFINFRLIQLLHFYSLKNSIDLDILLDYKILD